MWGVVVVVVVAVAIIIGVNKKPVARQEVIHPEKIDNNVVASSTPAVKTETIKPAPKTLSVKVIAPNGGEVWKMGEKKEISWRSANFPEPTSGNGVSAPSDVVTIFINTESVDSPPLYKFIDEVPRTKNSYLWTVGSVRNDSLLAGTYYIKVCRQGSFCDWSDTQLTITN